MIRARTAGIGAGSAAFLIAMVVANAGNVAFHLVASRRLGPAHYGALASTLGLLLAVSLPAASLQVAVTRSVARLAANGGRFSVRGLLTRGVTATIVVSLALVAASAPVADLLGLSSPLALAWLALFVPALLVTTVTRGVLMGEQRLVTLAAIVVVTTATRMTAAFTLLRPGDTEVEAVALTVLVEYLLAGAMTVAIVPRLGLAARRVRVAVHEFAGSASALVGLWLLLATDLFVARIVLTPEESGLYAATAMGARAALFLPQAVAHLAHARLAGDPGDDNPVVRLATAATLGFVALQVAGMAVLGPWIVQIGFGAEYAPDRSLVIALTLASSLLAVANLQAHVRLALGRRCRQVWLALPTVVVAALLLPGDPVWLAGASILGGAVAVGVLDPSLRMRTRSTEPVPAATTGDGVEVSLVLPARGLPSAAVRTAVGALADRDLELVAVDLDGTADVAAWEALAPNTTVFGAGLRRPPADAQTAFHLGVPHTTGQTVVLYDPASGAAPATVTELVALRELYDADIVVASRRHPESVVDYPAHRRALSWAFQQLVGVLFDVSVRDSQVAAKALAGRTARSVVPELSTRGLVWELELLVTAAARRHRRLIEAPVHVERPTAPLDTGAAVRFVGSVLRLRLRRSPTTAGRRPVRSLERAS